RLHIASRVPAIIRKILPKDALILEEEAWNLFPNFKTVYKNLWLKDKFTLILESTHIDGISKEQNPLKMSEAELKIRKVDVVDIAEPKKKSKEYKCNEDVTVFHSEKTGRGPLKLKWVETAEADGLPVTTAHKAAKMEFKVFGLQTIVEKFGVNVCRGVCQNAIRQQFCWIDEYFGWSMDDIQKYELNEAEETKKIIAEGPLAIDPNDFDENMNAETPPSVPQDTKQINEVKSEVKEETKEAKTEDTKEE
ncbi:MAG: putative phosphatidylinositol transfer protein, partial [Streblomastix strix]